MRVPLKSNSTNVVSTSENLLQFHLLRLWDLIVQFNCGRPPMRTPIFFEDNWIKRSPLTWIPLMWFLLMQLCFNFSSWVSPAPLRPYCAVSTAAVPPWTPRPTMTKWQSLQHISPFTRLWQQISLGRWLMTASSRSRCLPAPQATAPQGLPSGTLVGNSSMGSLRGCHSLNTSTSSMRTMTNQKEIQQRGHTSQVSIVHRNQSCFKGEF